MTYSQERRCCLAKSIIITIMKFVVHKHPFRMFTLPDLTFNPFVADIGIFQKSYVDNVAGGDLGFCVANLSTAMLMAT